MFVDKSTLVILLDDAAIDVISVQPVVFNDVILLLLQIRLINDVLDETSKDVRLLKSQVNPVMLGKNSIPVKSAIPKLEIAIDPLKLIASLTWISLSELVFMDVCASKWALKLASGMFTVWAKAPKLSIDKTLVLSIVFFMIVIFIP